MSKNWAHLFLIVSLATTISCKELVRSGSKSENSCSVQNGYFSSVQNTKTQGLKTLPSINSNARYMVTFRKDVSISLVDKLLAGLDYDLLVNSAIAIINPSVNNFLLKDILGHYAVVAIEADSVSRILSQAANNGLVETTPPSLTSINGINAEQAWSDYQVSGAGVRVGIIDTGIDYHHEDLRVAGGVSFVSSDYKDDHDGGHGTHVAGTVCAEENDMGTIGIAHNCDLFAIKVLDKEGTGTDSDIIKGIEWAIGHDLDVINLSLGREGGSSVAYERALQSATSNSIVIVASSGNSNEERVLYPASSPETIAVGSVAHRTSNERSSFSNWGAELDIVAPGEGIFSTLPDNDYGNKSGTSMSAPHVTGVVALMKEYDSSATPTQIKKILACSALDRNVEGHDDQTGYGFLDAFEAIDRFDECSADSLIAPEVEVIDITSTRQGDDVAFVITLENNSNLDFSDMTVELMAEQLHTLHEMDRIKVVPDADGRVTVSLNNVQCGGVKLHIKRVSEGSKTLVLAGPVQHSLDF